MGPDGRAPEPWNEGPGGGENYAPPPHTWGFNYGTGGLYLIISWIS